MCSFANAEGLRAVAAALQPAVQPAALLFVAWLRRNVELQAVRLFELLEFARDVSREVFLFFFGTEPVLQFFFSAVRREEERLMP